MIFKQTQNGFERKTKREMMLENPNISFPEPLIESVINEFGYYTLNPVQAPTYDPSTQILEELPPVLVDGVLVQQWSVRDLTQEELDAKLEEHRQAMVVSKRQGKQQMIIMGIIDQVEPAINAITDPLQRALVKSYWDDSTEYFRNHPQMIQLAESIGLTPEQLDQAFIAAAELD